MGATSSFTLMFMAESSATKYLNTKGSVMVCTTSFFLQDLHVQRRVRSDASVTDPMAGFSKYGDKILPQSIHTLACKKKSIINSKSRKNRQTCFTNSKKGLMPTCAFSSTSSRCYLRFKSYNPPFFLSVFHESSILNFLPTFSIMYLGVGYRAKFLTK